MSLGLLTGYGSDSDPEEMSDETQTLSHDEIQTQSNNEIQTQSNDSEPSKDAGDTDSNVSTAALLERNKHLIESYVGAALSLPPPPPPPPPPTSMGPLPNPLKNKKPKQRLPAIGRREMELLKQNSNWTEITTTEVDEDAVKPEFEYVTPLPFSASGSASDPDKLEFSEQTDPQYDYLSYVAEYKNYMANSAKLIQGQEDAAAAKAADPASSEDTTEDGEPSTKPTPSSVHGDEWTEYMQEYSEWFAQYGSQAAGVAAPAVPIIQKSFEELQAQDRELDAYFNSAPANEYNSQRDAFKSSFRGTRMYRMKNKDNPHNSKHFNQLSQGAKQFAKMYPKQKSVFEDKDAYVADKDLPENQDPKSLKQRKKDKWFKGMVEKGKGCKKCGFVFCRCYGWEYKPSHVK